MQPDAIHYENAHRNTFIAFLLKHDGHQKSIKSRDFSDFRNVAQFERSFFVRTDKFNLHEINNLFIFYCLVKRQCPLFCKFRLVKVICFTRDFHTQRRAPLQRSASLQKHFPPVLPPDQRIQYIISDILSLLLHQIRSSLYNLKDLP